MLALVNGGTFDSATGGTFQSDTDGTFNSDIPGTFESDMGGTFKVLQSLYPILYNIMLYLTSRKLLISSSDFMLSNSSSSSFDRDAYPKSFT